MNYNGECLLCEDGRCPLCVKNLRHERGKTNNPFDVNYIVVSSSVDADVNAMPSSVDVVSSSADVVTTKAINTNTNIDLFDKNKNPHKLKISFQNKISNCFQS